MSLLPLISKPTVLLDANVLYPAPIRDLLVQCASAGLYQGKLTEKIYHEWVSNLLKNRPTLQIEQLERTFELLKKAMPDCIVMDYEPLAEGLNLPDPDDRHVLAAAIASRSHIIVTCNLKDFPQKILEPFGIKAMHPDILLRSQANSALPLFLECVKTIRQRLKNPPIPSTQYLINLTALGLVQTASFLDEYIQFL